MNRAVLEHEEALPEQRRTGFSIAFSYSPLLLFSVSDKTLLILLGTMKKNTACHENTVFCFLLLIAIHLNQNFQKNHDHSITCPAFFFFFFKEPTSLHSE